MQHRIRHGVITNFGIGLDVGRVFSWIRRTPSNLIATVISSTEIDLTWTDGINSSDGISIERSEDGIIYIEIDTASYGDEIYSDTGLDASTLYYYRIRAYKL